MKGLTIYLSFNGQTEEAFNFYKNALGKEFSAIQRYKEMPGAPIMPDEFGNKILHVALPIAPGHTLMGADSVEGMSPAAVIQGNNFSITIETDTEEEARKIFANLSAGGTIVMPFEKTFWGALFGMITDKFGIQWMISFTYEQ